MNPYITSIFSLISFALLWVFLFWFYRDYCIDSFRQKIFQLRDELFDAAMAGEIPFNHKAYGRLRLTMNGTIRFAHQISLFHFLIVTARHSKPTSDGYTACLLREMQDLNKEQTKKFEEIYRKFSDTLLRQILISSPISALIFSFCAMVFWLLKRIFLEKFVLEIMKKLCTPPLEEVQTMAYTVGDDRSLAAGC